MSNREHDSRPANTVAAVKVKKGAYLIKEEQIKHLEGRLLTLIEAMVPIANQPSAKSLVSQEVWDLVEEYIWIDPIDVKRITDYQE